MTTSRDAAINDMLNTLKFFPRDRISGKMAKVGDRFTALFFGMKSRFEVIEVCSGFVIAKAV